MEIDDAEVDAAPYRMVKPTDPDYADLRLRLINLISQAGSAYRWSVKANVHLTLVLRITKEKRSIGPTMHRAILGDTIDPTAPKKRSRSDVIQSKYARKQFRTAKAQMSDYDKKHQAEMTDTSVKDSVKLSRASLSELMEISDSDLPPTLRITSPSKDCLAAGVRKVEPVLAGAKPRFFVLRK
jgi:hypothetical protein